MSQLSVSSTSTAARSTPSGGSSTGSISPWIRVLIFVVGGLGLMVIIWLWIITFGSVGGEEFSPERFQRRSFTFYQIPGLGVQISPVVRETSRNGFEKFLISNKYVSVTASEGKARWDLVRDSQHHPEAADCDAAILCEYLDTTTDKGGWKWQKWSEDNAKKAKLLWPIVAEFARAEMYIYIPDLLSAVERSEQQGGFTALLNQTAADSYCRLAQVEQGFDRHQKAVELFGVALRHDPEHVASLRGRAQSRRALGENEKAAADLAEANRIERE
ncbi:MAG: tetratricopeptide repeat protein [Pirellulaceae bacterium]